MKTFSTVVVIGPGPFESGMCGADIDCHPVVRLWDNDWQTAARYGSRYDYGLMTRSKNRSDATRRPSKAWLFYNVPHELTIPNIDAVQVAELDHVVWYRKARAHGAKQADTRQALKFTRGFAAVAGTIGYLRPKRVIIIGMDLLKNGVTGHRHYDPAAIPFNLKTYPDLAIRKPEWAADEMPAGLRGDGPHDYFTESKVVRELANEAGIELLWID